MPLPAAATGLPSAAAAAAAAALATACSCSPSARHLESRLGSGASKLITWVGKRLAMGLCLLGNSGFAAALPYAMAGRHAGGHLCCACCAELFPELHFMV